MILNSRDITPGAIVIAGNYMDPNNDRTMKVLRTFEHNGRPAFDARVSLRAGEEGTPMADRLVWRYVSQVTRIVRKAR